MCKLISFIVPLLFIFLPQRCFAQESDVDLANDVKPPTIDELLLFYPAKFPAGNWTPQDLRFQDVYFDSEDKTKLHGWYCPCDNPRAVVLLAHVDHNNWITDAYLKQLDEFIAHVGAQPKR